MATGEFFLGLYDLYGAFSGMTETNLRERRIIESLDVPEGRRPARLPRTRALSPVTSVALAHRGHGV